MQSYRSLNPNHVHLLMVAPSKHYYAGQDGVLKYQKKPFDVSLRGAAQSKRQHMVMYVLRDHFTALQYAEVCFAPSFISLQAFLGRAWRAKKGTPLRGVPEILLTSKRVLDFFADDAENIAALGVRILPATSGFQSGIHGALAVERHLSICIGHPYRDLSPWLGQFCEFDARGSLRSTGRTKADVWLARAKHVRELPSEWGVK